jgi:hypothetical protein
VKYGRAFLPSRCLHKVIKVGEPYKVIAMTSVNIHDEMSQKEITSAV